MIRLSPASTLFPPPHTHISQHFVFASAVRRAPGRRAPLPRGAVHPHAVPPAAQAPVPAPQKNHGAVCLPSASRGARFRPSPRGLRAPRLGAILFLIRLSPGTLRGREGTDAQSFKRVISLDGQREGRRAGDAAFPAAGRTPGNRLKKARGGERAGGPGHGPTPRTDTEATSC